MYVIFGNGAVIANARHLDQMRRGKSAHRRTQISPCSMAASLRRSSSKIVQRSCVRPSLYYRLNLKFTPARSRFSVKPTLTLNGVPTGQTAWFTVNGQVPLTAPLPRFT